MNPSQDGGSPPRPIRHLRVAEHRAQDLFSESSPLHSAVGSKNGYRLHQPGRPAYEL